MSADLPLQVAVTDEDPSGRRGRGNRADLGDPGATVAPNASLSYPHGQIGAPTLSITHPGNGKTRVRNIAAGSRQVLLSRQLAETVVAFSYPGQRYSSVVAVSGAVGHITGICAGVASPEFPLTVGSLGDLTPEAIDQFEIHVRGRIAAETQPLAQRSASNMWSQWRILLGLALDFHGIDNVKLRQRLAITIDPVLRRPETSRTEPLPKPAYDAIKLAALRHFRQVRAQVRAGGDVRLDSDQVLTMMILVALQQDIEPDCLKALTVNCLGADDGTTAQLLTRKNRKRGNKNPSDFVSVRGAASAGAIIRLAIGATEPARLRAAADLGAPIDDLWVAFPLRGSSMVRFAAGSTCNRVRLRQWLRRREVHGLTEVNGEPLKPTFHRMRKSERELDYTRDGNLDRVARRHTADVAGNYYFNTDALADVHDGSAVNGLSDMFEVPGRILRPEDPADNDGSDETLAVIAGQRDMHTGACRDVTDGPWAPAGQVCPVAGHACWGCPNSVLVVSDRHLRAVLRYQRYLTQQREVMADAEFVAVHGVAWSIIERRYLPEFPAAAVAEARNQLDDTDIYIPREQQ